MANPVVITTLVDINGKITSAVSSINANFAAIVAALANTLALDGTNPNSMLASLDMNNNRILNLPTPVNPTDPIRLIDWGNPTTTYGLYFATLPKTDPLSVGQPWNNGGFVAISDGP